MPYLVEKIYTEDDLKLAFEIRKEVFVLEQGVDEKLENDEFEFSSTHFLVKDLFVPIGTARMRNTGYGIKLERFAILPEYRNRGLGKLLCKTMLDSCYTLLHPHDDPNYLVYLNAQVQAIPFYEKMGFSSEGGLFQEAEIWHQKMILEKKY